MKRLVNTFYLLTFTVFFIACGTESSTETTSAERKPVNTGKYAELQETARGIFGELPISAENPDNPATAEKVALGKKLYFDVRLSKDNKVSCNSCHNLKTFGVDNLPFSPGNDGELGGRNSPTVLNVALDMAQFWDGRSKDVEEQAGEPILNPVEMAIPSEEFLVDRLKGIDEYQPLFAAAFPEDDQPLTYANLENAIGAFERKLITPSRFDEFIAGDESALSSWEIRGLEAFINTGCTSCHSGNTLGGQKYEKFGVYGDYWEMTHSKNIDKGRFDVTGKEEDMYKFKVPSLRNVAKTGPYFHDGSVSTLKEAVIQIAKLQLDKDLSSSEADDIIVFLNSLTGEVPAEYQQI